MHIADAVMTMERTTYGTMRMDLSCEKQIFYPFTFVRRHLLSHHLPIDGAVFEK
jgi:hypothetical protein